MKYILALICAFILAACGDGGGGQTNPIVIDPGGQVVRVDLPYEYGLEIPTSGNRVTVGTRNTVTYVLMSGTGNILNVEPFVLIRSLDVSGSNNTVNLSNNVTVPIINLLGTNPILNISDGDRVDQLNVVGSNAVVTIATPTALVTRISLSGSNIVLKIPAGYQSQTTITNTGGNNTIQEF